MATQGRIICGILAVAVAFFPGYAQKISKCRTSLPEAPKYRVATTRRANFKGESILVLQISLAPDHFNEQDMTALAKRLTAEFCREKQLSIAITDQYDAARSPDLITDLMRKTPHPALRGAYNLDRVAGNYDIGFSTQRGRPLDEVQLRFEISSKPPTPKSQ